MSHMVVVQREEGKRDIDVVLQDVHEKKEDDRTERAE